MHPSLHRMRPAQARAKHLLDTEDGAATVAAPDGLPNESLELAFRTGARELLDHDTRVWLAWAEQTQTLAAFGQPPLADEPDRPARLGELHELVTLAHHAEHGPG